MANPEHLEIIKQGVDAWNAWRQEHPEIEPNLANADLNEMRLNEANLNNTDLRRADLQNTDFRGADMIRADLRAANISKASFNLAKLSEANFSEAYLRESDFSEADLRRAYFIRTDLVRVDLWQTNLNRADFRWSYIIGSDLKRATLNQSDLRWAHLSETNLAEADLNRANLIKTSFIKTDLNHAIFKEVAMAWTCFVDVDLSDIKELHTARHFGPTSIGIDTILRSKGRISETFLRGAGVSEGFIQNMALLAENPSGYHRCFISYSAKDLEFAEKLLTDLQTRGVRCWTAAGDMKIGDKTWDSIYHFIRMRDKFVLILSENSTASDWIEDEVNAALEEENKHQIPILFPIRIDSAPVKTDQAWAEYIKKTRNIGDFAGWKDHDTYQQALEKLLEALKA